MVTYVQVTVGVWNLELCNCDICIGYSWCGECGIVTYVQVTVALLNVELCNSVSISMLWQHKISMNQWMEYRKKYRNSKNFIWLMSHTIKIRYFPSGCKTMTPDTFTNIP